MFCSNCGKPINEDISFCNSCGAATTKKLDVKKSNKGMKIGIISGAGVLTVALAAVLVFVLGDFGSAKNISSSRDRTFATDTNGRGTYDSPTASPGSAPQAIDTRRETLVVATSADFPPFEFINDNGEYDGFDIHVARAIANYLDMELRIDNMDFTSVIPSVTTGASDIGIAAITANDERRVSVDFSTPYFKSELVVVVRSDDNITSVQRLTDWGYTGSVAVQLNTTGDLMAGWFLEDADIRRYERVSDMVTEINVRRVEAIIVDIEAAHQLVNNYSGLRILNEKLAIEEYSIAVSKNNPVLAEKINNSIRYLIASGEMAQIYDRFFGGQ